MHRLKKLLLLFTLLSVFALSFALPVSANSPAPAHHLTVFLSNLPEDAVYADLLIKIDPDDPNFVDFQLSAYSGSVSNATEIVRYSEDGFYSFTFHYKDAASNIKIANYYDDTYYVDFCNSYQYQDYLSQYESLLSHYRDIKIALLDKDFNIIVVSQAAKLPQDTILRRFNGDVNYDFRTNSLDCHTISNTSYLVLSYFFSMVLIVMSVGTEIVTALLFRFRGKQIVTVLVVNVCSQVAMRLLYLILPFTYLIETIILEVLVYSVEFVIYKVRFKRTSTAKLLWYTITANTLSLLLGIYLDYLIWI